MLQRWLPQVGAIATPSWRWEAVVRPWRCSASSVAASRPRLPCYATAGWQPKCCARVLRTASYPAKLAGAVYSQLAVRSTPAKLAGPIAVRSTPASLAGYLPGYPLPLDGGGPGWG